MAANMSYVTGERGKRKERLLENWRYKVPADPAILTEVKLCNCWTRCRWRHRDKGILPKYLVFFFILCVSCLLLPWELNVVFYCHFSHFLPFCTFLFVELCHTSLIYHIYRTSCIAFVQVQDFILQTLLDFGQFWVVY